MDITFNQLRDSTQLQIRSNQIQITTQIFICRSHFLQTIAVARYTPTPSNIAELVEASSVSV